MGERGSKKVRVRSIGVGNGGGDESVGESSPEEGAAAARLPGEEKIRKVFKGLNRKSAFGAFPEVTFAKAKLWRFGTT